MGIDMSKGKTVTVKLGSKQAYRMLPPFFYSAAVMGQMLCGLPEAPQTGRQVDGRHRVLLTRLVHAASDSRQSLQLR